MAHSGQLAPTNRHSCAIDGPVLEVGLRTTGRQRHDATDVQLSRNFAADRSLVAQLLRNFRPKKGLHILQPTCTCNGNFPDREDPANATSATAVDRTSANSSPRRSAAFRRMKSCRRSPRDRQSGMDCADSDAAGCSPRHREGDQPSYLARVIPTRSQAAVDGTQCCHAADRRSAQIRVADHLRRRSHGSSSIRRDL